MPLPGCAFPLCNTMHSATVSSIQLCTRGQRILKLFSLLRGQVLADLRYNRFSNPQTFRLTPRRVPNRNEFLVLRWHNRNHLDIQRGSHTYLNGISVRSRSSSRVAHHEHRER